MNPMLTQEIGFFLSSSTAMRIAAVNSLFFGFCKGPSWPGKKKVLFGFLKAVRFHLFALTQIPQCAKLTDR